MALRAEQWLMLGVGAVGAYAVYRLVTAPKDQAPKDVPILKDAGPIVQPPQALAGPILPMKQGVWYKGRVESVPTATREDLLRMLQDLGFEHVTTYMTLAVAGDEIALAAAIADPTSGTHWFQGHWTKPTGGLSRPAGLVMIWPTVVPVKKTGTAGVRVPVGFVGARRRS